MISSSALPLPPDLALVFVDQFIWFDGLLVLLFLIHPFPSCES